MIQEILSPALQTVSPQIQGILATGLRGSPYTGVTRDLASAYGQVMGWMSLIFHLLEKMRYTWLTAFCISMRKTLLNDLQVSPGIAPP